MVPEGVWGSFLEQRGCVFFLSSCSVWGRLLLSLFRVLLLCLFMRRLRFSAVCPAAGYPWGLRNLSGSCCLSCSYGGARFVGFAVSLVRRLVFYLVPCSSSGACGLRSLPCRRLPLGVFCLFCHRLPDLLLHWWRRLGGNPSLVLSVLLLHRLACRGSLGSAPCVRELPGL